MIVCTGLLFQMELFKCSEYPAVFTAERNLLRHMKSQHTGGGSTCVCEDCGATYSRGDNLIFHENNINQTLPLRPQKATMTEVCEEGISTEPPLV